MNRISYTSAYRASRQICLCLVWLLGACGQEEQRRPSPRSLTDLPAQVETSQPKWGRWHPLDPAERGLTEEQRQALDRLQALPYLSGNQPVPPQSGVTKFQRSKVQPGINLYNSGHAPEALAIDLGGNILHRWSFPIEKVWKDVPEGHQKTYWRRVTWLPGGDVLAIFEGIGLLRLDSDSNLKWAFRAAFHHQAVPDFDGTILVLARKKGLIPRINPDQPVFEDSVVRLTSDGQFLEQMSLLEAFENSPYRNLLDSAEKQGDFFHTNSIEVLDGSWSNRNPAFARGNLLLSIFFLDTICVLDPEKKEIVWALRGDRSPSFQGQHDPRLLPNGDMLLFDNWGRSGQSKVIEFDPVTLQISWQYPKNSETGFVTPTCGTSQRLENGNTLITESDRGRAFEVTPGGEIVWEFLNPHRAGDQDEFIATLFEVRRVDRSFLR